MFEIETDGVTLKLGVLLTDIDGVIDTDGVVDAQGPPKLISALLAPPPPDR